MRKSVKTVITAVAIMNMMMCTACGGQPEPETSTQQSQKQSESTTVAVPRSSETEKQTFVTEPVESEETETKEVETEETETEKTSEQVPSASNEVNDKIVKINGGADDVGIYSIVVRMTDQAADKGVVEMVYKGAVGSPQEDSVVCTFRIEYCKESTGTFEIATFYDGEVYQNQHHKEEVKVTNTFGATLRAGSVVISYTPDGGETQEVFSADADYFR